jgi:hypothetical protein
MLSFAARLGTEGFNIACRRALQYGDNGYQTISEILEKRVDNRTDDEPGDDQALPPHKNKKIK